MGKYGKLGGRAGKGEETRTDGGREGERRSGENMVRGVDRKGEVGGSVCKKRCKVMS